MMRSAVGFVSGGKSTAAVAAMVGGMLIAVVLVGCGDDEKTIFAPTRTAAPGTATPDETETAAATETEAAMTPTATASGTAAAPTATSGAGTATPEASQTPAATRTPTGTPTQPTQPPNIVLIILDDVGIDQVEAFGLGQGNLASSPNLTTLAEAGVRFSNTWSMPECSPSRATIFTGRYPLRTGVTSALIPNMLPQSQVSPYESTLPRLLAEAGYTSAMVGKYHLGNRNPAGNCSPQTTGFDYFDGNMEAGPPSIDPQAGQVQEGAPTDEVCGYDEDDSAVGNCYFIDGTCQAEMVNVPNADGGTDPAPVTGRNCLEAGGIFVRENGDCQTTSSVTCPDDSDHTDCVELEDGSAILDFDRPNGYYVWPDTILSGVLPPGTSEFTDPECGEPPLSRQYMTIAQSDGSIDWYNQQTGPRMVTVSYNSIHTPYQPAPSALASLVSEDLICGDVASDRILGNNMLESMDREIGRLLSSLGLATIDENGVIQTEVDDDGYTQIPELLATNTMVAVVGDNGSFFDVVKPPFDVLRSKGSVYQTGVWVPLIVSGPPVAGATGREVDAMVNIADLFGLFAEVAGIDVESAVPPAHQLDSEPMLPYLTNPDQEPIRQFNFTQLGSGVFEQPPNPDTRSWPCVLLVEGANVCNQVIANTQDFCNTNSGVWWGPTDTPEPQVVAVLGDQASQGLSTCCQVQQAVSDAGMGTILNGPIEQFAVRNQAFKLIDIRPPDCDNDDGSVPPVNLESIIEFYDLTNFTTSNPLGIDFASQNLLCIQRISNSSGTTCIDGSPCDDSDPTSCLNDEQQVNYDALQEEMMRVLDSQQTCTGDGNLDRRVNQFDADGVTTFAAATSPLTMEVGGQSFFDLNGDAKTNDADGEIVSANLGSDCVGECKRADLNRDGYVDDVDEELLDEARGSSCELCGADLNGDGEVNDADAEILEGFQGCSTPAPTLTPVPTHPVPTGTIPPPVFCQQTCLPDLTDRQCGCDLFVPGETMIPPEANIDCNLVCEEYAACSRASIEVAFTCDAALCTSNDDGLVIEACYGLQACSVSETLRAEAAAECSCCASQLCGCDPDFTTNRAIFFLNAEQREAGETPQCDINGTLCGQP